MYIDTAYKLVSVISEHGKKTNKYTRQKQHRKS